MHGVSIIDILVSILKFEDFKEQTTMGKIKWIIGYPFALLVLVGLIAAFFISSFITVFRFKK